MHDLVAVQMEGIPEADHPSAAGVCVGAVLWLGIGNLGIAFPGIPFWFGGCRCFCSCSPLVR